jgi:WD40 repeat protein
MRRCTWVGMLLVVLGCSGASGGEEAEPAAAAPAAAPAVPAEPPEPVEPPPEVPEGVDEAALPAAAAPPAGLDPAFDAAQPTRGGLFAPFEAVPQDAFDEVIEGATVVSPDGRLTAVASPNGTVAVYDSRLGVVRAARRFFRSAYDSITFAWDSSSNHVAAYAHGSGELCLWRLPRDEYVCTQQADASRGLSVARNGTRVVYQNHPESPQSVFASWTVERRPQPIAELPPEMDVRRSAAFAHHVLVDDGEHSWLYTAWGRSAPPIDLGEVTFPEHPFAPNGRSFITLSDTSVQQRNPSDGVVQQDVPIANAKDRVRVVIQRDGSRAALCAPDGPVVHVRLGRNPVAEEVATAVCTDASRPTLTRTSADVVTLDAEGLDTRRHRDVRMNGREFSLWSLEIGEGRVVTHRRGGAERFSAAGVRRVQSTAGVVEDTHDDGGWFNGLVARSPSRRTVLRVTGSNRPVLVARESRVTLADAERLACDEYMGCAVTASWDHDERRVALMHPNAVEVFDATTGARLGHWVTGRGCRDDCDEGTVCMHGQCEPAYTAIGNAEFSPSGERLVTVASDGSVGLFSVSGERLQRLAPPDARALGRQSFAFSPDSELIALVRRRRLTVVRAADGTEVWNVNLVHPLATMAFSADGQQLNVIDTDKKQLRISVADGSQLESREVGALRGVDGHGRYAVTCREGLTYLQYLGHGTERGPLGRCPPDGRFTVAPDTGLLGYIHGTLARVHRLSDGEVLNIRSIWRESTRIYIVYTDSGWAQVIGGRNADVYIRTGPIPRGGIRQRGSSDRIRETLLADFFGGVALPPAPSPGDVAAAAAAETADAEDAAEQAAAAAPAGPTAAPAGTPGE